MVRYYGRAKTRTGSVNTNQLGLKMSGCPSRVGRNPVNARYIAQRVACNRGICGIPVVHEVIPWRVDMTNSNHFGRNFCQPRSTTCLAAAGGIGNINTPYYRTPAPGEGGCATGLDNPISLYLYSLEYENLANDTEVDSVILPIGTKIVVTTKNGDQIPATAASAAIVTKDSATGIKKTHQSIIVKAKDRATGMLHSFETGITKVVAALKDGAEKLEEKTLDNISSTAKKEVNKLGKMFENVHVLVHSAFAKEETKLKNTVKAAISAAIHKLEQAGLTKLQPVIDKVGEMVADIHHVLTELQKAKSGVIRKVREVTDLPKKAKEGYEKVKKEGEQKVQRAFDKGGKLIKKEAEKLKKEHEKHNHKIFNNIKKKAKETVAKAEKKVAEELKKL